MENLYQTSIPGILTTGSRLYSQKEEKFITRHYMIIEDFKQYVTSEGKIVELAEAVDQVCSENAVTTLTFFLNTSGKIVTNIYSSAFDMIRELYRDENYENFLAAEQQRLETHSLKKSNHKKECMQEMVDCYAKVFTKK